MMNKLSHFPTLFILFVFANVPEVTSQVTLSATPTCSSITAVPVNYYSKVFSNEYEQEFSFSNCNWDVSPCCKKINGPAPAPLEPRNFYLEGETWFNDINLGPQSSPTFSNLPHGKYRIKGDIPVSTVCEQGGFIDVYAIVNGSYQHIGRKGKYITMYTPWFIVGNTGDEGFVAKIVNSSNSPQTSFCYPDEVFLRDQSIYYNLYWIAIFENGGLNRWESTYWVNGTVHNNFTLSSFNLSQLWRSNHPTWEFVPGLSYTVQFVIENSACLNNPWNDKYLDFNIYPENACFRGNDPLVDRTTNSAEKSTIDLLISPNPANHSLFVQFDNELCTNCELTITNLTGQRVRNLPNFVNPEIDISELTNGVYIVSLFNENHCVANKKLVIQR